MECKTLISEYPCYLHFFFKYYIFIWITCVLKMGHYFRLLRWSSMLSAPSVFVNVQTLNEPCEMHCNESWWHQYWLFLLHCCMQHQHFLFSRSVWRWMMKCKKKKFLCLYITQAVCMHITKGKEKRSFFTDSPK